LSTLNPTTTTMALAHPAQLSGEDRAILEEIRRRKVLGMPTSEKFAMRPLSLDEMMAPENSRWPYNM
jgi:hypothetical protein